MRRPFQQKAPVWPLSPAERLTTLRKRYRDPVAVGQPSKPSDRGHRWGGLETARGSVIAKALLRKGTSGGKREGERERDQWDDAH